MWIFFPNGKDYSTRGPVVCGMQIRKNSGDCKLYSDFRLRRGFDCPKPRVVEGSTVYSFPIPNASRWLPHLAGVQALVSETGPSGGPGLSWKQGCRVHTLSQHAEQGRDQLRGCSLTSVRQWAVMQHVAAWNPKPPPAFLLKKLSLQLRTLTACSLLDHGRAGLPRE